jgi:hypothetical protein
LAELDEALLGEDLGIGGGGGGVDAADRDGQAVDADGVAVEVLLEGLPGVGLGEGVEEVGEAVVVSVEGSDGFAEAGLEGEPMLVDPGFEAVEAVVPLGEEEGEPDGGNFAGGEVSLPVGVSGEVLVDQLGEVELSESGEEDGDVVHGFDAPQLRSRGHPAELRPGGISEKAPHQ